MSDREAFRYSITCHTEDQPVVHCLRALAHFAERDPQKMTAWGGTGIEDWQRDENCITFRFTHPEYRKVFRDVASEILEGRWSEIGTSDNDPPEKRRGARRGRR